MSRKIFNINNISVTAGGILLYRYRDDKVQFLMIQKKGIHEDIGGKATIRDIDIVETIRREIHEESNNILNIGRDRFYNSIRIINPGSKYCIYLLKANQNESNLNEEVFGKVEHYNGKERTFHWISMDEYFLKLKNRRLNNRLYNRILSNNISKLIYKV